MAKLGDLITTCNGRLTLTSGTPVTTSDVTAATTLYYTPYRGDNIALYNGEEWLFYEFSELSLSLSGYTADTNYDIWMYDNSGVLTLDSTAWSSDTARATALATQNGVYAKTGDILRRYLGTIRTTSTTGQCEDSLTKRYCWNYYNRTQKRLYYTPGETNWTYGTNAWRIWNNNSAYKFELVIGVAEISIHVVAAIMANTSLSYYAHVGIQENATTSAKHQLGGRILAPGQDMIRCHYISTPTIGYHYYHPMELSESGTVTYYSYGAGSQFSSGIIGIFEC